MMNSNTMETLKTSDADLVAESLKGNRDAFGQIVAKYQVLLCSLAYSGTGDFNRSEDLAQETFVAAWKQLGSLREPQKLRFWLCQITRHLTIDTLKKQRREPSHRAVALEEITPPYAADPCPLDGTMSKEEQEILWRVIERIPEIYREPLILFYRENESIAAVAQSLELSEEAVKQRLSRGRKLVQAEAMAFVEGALKRTRPGAVFTVGVLAAVAGLSPSAKAAAAGAVATKSGAAAKTATLGGVFSFLFGQLTLFSGHYVGYRIGMESARSEDERRRRQAVFRRNSLVSLALFIPLAALYWRQLRFDLLMALVIIYSLVSLVSDLAAAAGNRRIAPPGAGDARQPAWEYRSGVSFLALPLVHIRIGEGASFEPVKAWVAIGCHAYGGLFALGKQAVAPLSLGFRALGLFPIGMVALGLFPIGVVGLGGWSYGGLAIGWQAMGACALGWNAAWGDFSWAHTFPLRHGDFAERFMESHWFFRRALALNRSWMWWNCLWMIPSLVWWRLSARARRRAGQA